jgi:diguanylate cyclase
VLPIEINRAKRNRHSLNLLSIDVDNFKLINDNFGHKIGDDALIHLTQSIKKFLTKDDVFARLGGDEFVIIFDKTDFTTCFQSQMS